MDQPPPPLPPDVLAALERRRPIEALRLLLGGRDLAARLAAQRGSARRSAPPPSASVQSKPALRSNDTAPAFDGGLSPGEVPRSRSTFWGWIVLLLLLYLALRVLRM